MTIISIIKKGDCVTIFVNYDIHTNKKVIIDKNLNKNEQIIQNTKSTCTDNIEVECRYIFMNEMFIKTFKKNKKEGIKDS